MSTALARLTEAEKALAAVETIDDVKTWDANLAALDEFARQMHWPVEELNRLIELRALFQRRGGVLIEDIPKKQGQRDTDGLLSALERSGVAVVSQHRWRLLTRLEEAVIREVIAARTDAGQTVTLGYLYGLAMPPKPVVVPPDFPAAPFRTLVIDPPWPIEKVEFARRKHERASLDYATAPLSAIEALPIPQLAHSEGAHVYLWVTHRFLPAGLALFAAWGVRYECVLTWVKPTAQPFWWRFTTEHVLFGKVGTLAPLRKGAPTHFAAPQQRHSHKPDVFFELVQSVSPGPRLTMYDQAREGFECWGMPHAVSE